MTVFVARCAAVGRDKRAVKNRCSDGTEWSVTFPEGGGIRFIRHVVTYIPVHTASRLSRVELRTALACVVTFRGPSVSPATGRGHALCSESA
jgi:hypothetical protein